jgi:hypothetical protein
MADGVRRIATGVALAGGALIFKWLVGRTTAARHSSSADAVEDASTPRMVRTDGTFLFKWVRGPEAAATQFLSQTGPMEETASLDRMLGDDLGSTIFGEVERSAFDAERVKVAFLFKWSAGAETPTSQISSPANTVEETTSPDLMLEDEPGLATLGEVERAIYDVEKVRVAFLDPSGFAVQSNKRGLLPYPYQRKSPSDDTVSAFIEQRLAPFYEHHGMRIVLQAPDGLAVPGETILGHVRESFGF